MNKFWFFVGVLFLFVAFAFIRDDGRLAQFHSDGAVSSNFTINPPAGLTGAPGEGNCTQCHTSSVFPADGAISYDYSGTDDKYKLDSTYQINLNTDFGFNNGFQMVILDSALNNAGMFSAGIYSSVIVDSGKTYIRQNSSVGVYSWTFDWQAPINNQGDLTVYYSFNVSNNDLTVNGDAIYLGQKTIYSSYYAGISDHNKLDGSYRVWTNNETQFLQVEFDVLKRSKVILTVQSIIGRVVLKEDFGYLDVGSYNEEISLPHSSNSGSYVVSLFVGNEVLNRKVIY